MNGYKMNKIRLLRGAVMLLLAAAAAVFVFEVFKGYTPFGYKGEYIKASVVRVLKNPQTEEIQCVDVVYNVGLTRFEARLPSACWYLEGSEVGDKFTVPYHQHDFDDMNRDERTALGVLAAVFCIFLLAGIFPVAGEICAHSYFARLIRQEKCVYADYSGEQEKGGKIRAVCRFEKHEFFSRYYPKRDYPFTHGGKVRVYVDMGKDPEKYLVSEY
ncbi:MAG: hypothetical protein NC253_08525 [Ruminococcus sp.]|nr:hypothetical protein [Ruminococcus sp.]MCM1382203.1 hypothetical protein [Muribaculaceae bacterium]MCM1478958.1 hypothetical protein [Muribaculaceae bacterium]